MKRLAVAVLGTAALALCAPLPVATANPLTCVTNAGFWLFHGTQRTLCDTPRSADGSWVRYREFWTPAHNVPLSTYCSGGSYYSSCTTSGGYWVPRSSNGIETYPVTDADVLPDEPGWITT